MDNPPLSASLPPLPPTPGTSSFACRPSLPDLFQSKARLWTKISRISRSADSLESAPHRAQRIGAAWDVHCAGGQEPIPHISGGE